MMKVSQLPNRWLRMFVMVIGYMPVVTVVVFLEAGKVFVELMRETPSMAATVWAGEKR